MNLAPEIGGGSTSWTVSRSIERSMPWDGISFSMAAEIKVMFFGALGAKNIQNALQRILGRVKAQDFNCLEVTGIIAKRFLGVPYATVSAHSRHIQQSCQLDNIEQRQANQQEPSDSFAARESLGFPAQKAYPSAIAPE